MYAYPCSATKPDTHESIPTESNSCCLPACLPAAQLHHLVQKNKIAVHPSACFALLYNTLLHLPNECSYTQKNQSLGGVSYQDTGNKQDHTATHPCPSLLLACDPEDAF